MNNCYCINKLNQCFCFNQDNEYSSLNNIHKYSSFNNIFKGFPTEYNVNKRNLVIFNLDSGTSELFDFSNQLIYKHIYFDDFDLLKNIEYGNFKELDRTKCKIDLLDSTNEKYRKAATKYLHEYELIKLICKKRVISRAYFKLYELIFFEDIVNFHTLDCFFICEAPGGFIECITDIRRKKNLRTSYISISNDNDIRYDKFLEQDNLLYGDITKLDVLDNTILLIKEKFPNNIDFITADGGFDIQIFNLQEILSNKLILCEIYLAISTQKQNGMFIIKYFDMFTHNSIVSYLILCSFYKKVKIIKPNTSRNSNSERYLVCYSFIGIDDSNKHVLDNIREIIVNYRFTEPEENKPGVYTVIYPDFNFQNIPTLKQTIKKFNNIILREQIDTINNSLELVKSRDMYFKNLLINQFIEKKTIGSIFLYRNILNNRIIKCIEWLRTYKINTHQIVYRYNC